jgi:hypothetical protein
MQPLAGHSHQASSRRLPACRLHALLSPYIDLYRLVENVSEFTQ